LTREDIWRAEAVSGVKGKMIDFGTADHTRDYKPATLEEYKKIYAGSLK
jgi:hypothetical protein